MQMNTPDRLAQVQAVITGLFPGGVAVGVSDPCRDGAQPWGAEAAHLDKAVPKRRREFAAGRSAARDAMAKLGQTPVPVLAGSDRAPVWPKGVRGSISHSSTLCAAALTDAPLWLGLDLEPDSPLNADLLPTICAPTEAARIAGPEQLRLAKLVFSAKEAAYKAQYPATGVVFGFHQFDVIIDLVQNAFTATFTKNVGEFDAGRHIEGRFVRAFDHIITAVAIPLVPNLNSPNDAFVGACN